jgi:hypothetical protein
MKALIELRQDGYDIPLLPVVYIDADSVADAKEKLLYITSQYGEFNREGYNQFIDGFDFDLSGIRLTEGEFYNGYVEDGKIDPYDEWDGMPEFDQIDDSAYRSIIVHIMNEEALVDFKEKMGQDFGEKAKYIHYPKQERDDIQSQAYYEEE